MSNVYHLGGDRVSDSGDIENIKAERVSAVGIVGEGVRNPKVMERVFYALRQRGEIFNGQNDIKDGLQREEVIFIGPSDRQFSMFIRSDEDGGKAHAVVRTLHEVLFGG